MKKLMLLAVLLAATPAYAQLSIVQEERAKITAPPPVGTAAAFEVTKRVAARIGGGVLKKPAGNNVDGFAVDIVCFADGTIVDILGDSEGAASPAWNVLAEKRRPDECQIPPPGIVGTPPPPPPPGGVTRAELEAAIAGLRAELQGRLVEVNAIRREVTSELNALGDRVRALESKPVDLAHIQGAIAGALSELVVTGKTRTAFGHQHELGELRVTRKQNFRD